MKISPSNDSITASGRCHASGGSPAFIERFSRYSRTSHPHSTGTCGSSNPLLLPHVTISPCLPISILPGRSDFGQSMTCGTVITVTSTVICASSLSRRSGNRGSWQAERAASSRASPSGSTGSGMPMHPLRPWSGYVERVTNTPLFSANSPSVGRSKRPPDVSDSTADLAALTALIPVSSSVNRSRSFRRRRRVPSSRRSSRWSCRTPSGPSPWSSGCRRGPP